MTDSKATSTRGAKGKASDGFTPEERDAMKERAKELRAAKKKSSAADDAAAVLAKIAEMGETDRLLAERVHAVITSAAPDLAPRLWYGMPAYARDGKVVCFFQDALKFKARYATLGFSDEANLDEGAFWPTSFGLSKLTTADEEKLAELVKRAVS